MASLGRRSIAPSKPKFTVNYDDKINKFNHPSQDEDGFSTESESEFSDGEETPPIANPTPSIGVMQPTTAQTPSIVPPIIEEKEVEAPPLFSLPPIKEEPPSPKSQYSVATSATQHQVETPPKKIKKVKYAHTPEGKELKKKFAALCEAFAGNQKFKMPPEKITYDTALEYYEEMVRESDRMNSELEARFSILQSNNEKFEIKIPDRSLTYKERVDIHEEYVTNIVAHYNADNYQYILWIVMVAIELVGVKYFKLPINGYAEMQMQSMQRYRKFLVELGRVEGAEETTPTPPLLKIAFVAGFQLLVLLFVNWASSQLDNPKLSKVMISMITEVGDYFTGEKTMSASKDSSGLSSAPSGGGGSGIGDMIKGVGSVLVDAFMGNNKKEENIEVGARRSGGRRGVPEEF